MKRVLSLILMVIVVLGTLSGCGEKESSSGSKEKKLKIGFASNSFSDKWQTYLNDAAQAKADEMGVEIIFTDGKDDPATQLANIENLVIEGVDAIITVMVDTTAPRPIVNAAKNAGIPLIAVNRRFEGADVFVGSDDILAGEIQVNYLAEALNGKGNIALLQGMQGHHSMIKRTEGNENITSKYPDLNITLKDTGLWDRAKGMEIAENWLESGEQIDAIVANNDEMAIGAIRALIAANKLNDVVVAGLDGTIDALEYVQDGSLSVTVFQSPFGQGSHSVEAAIKLAKGEKVESYVDVPFEEITKDNVEEYVKLWN